MSASIMHAVNSSNVLQRVLVDDNGYDSVDYSKLDVDFKIIK